MKVKDLLKMDIDIDVCDDYDERCYIAFCGEAKLTHEGEERFRDALELPITLNIKEDRVDNICIISCDTEHDAESCRELFVALAGYCSESDYDRWFEE